MGTHLLVGERGHDARFGHEHRHLGRLRRLRSLERNAWAAGLDVGDHRQFDGG